MPQIGTCLVKEREQAITVTGAAAAVEVLDVRIGRQPTTDDGGPEPLNLCEVPQEVVGVPLGTGRHPILRSCPPQDLHEACRVASKMGQVVDVAGVRIAGGTVSVHGSNLSADPDSRCRLCRPACAVGRGRCGVSGTAYQ